jgi:hypothetical protein
VLSVIDDIVDCKLLLASLEKIPSALVGVNVLESVMSAIEN